jgi:hypothetical protein
MLGRIDRRADELHRYNEWLAGRKKQLHEFAQAWEKVKTGNNVFFEDTFYIISKEPIDLVPIGARNVIVRDVVTPQDLIDPNGRLKRPTIE